MMGAGFIIYIFFGRRLNLEQKILINESLSDATPSKIAPGSSIRLVINIFIMSVIFQIIGFIIIYILWQGKNLGNNYDTLFNAIFHYFLGDNHSLAFALTAYLLGLILGLLGKYKGWSWIN